MCRFIGNLCLSFEEMSTILTQVEACLISCPLCQILSNHKDPKALALGQFLIGGLIMGLLNSDYSHIPVSYLDGCSCSSVPHSIGENGPWIIRTNCAPTTTVLQVGLLNPLTFSLSQ